MLYKRLESVFHTRRDISHSIRLELPEAFSSVVGSESISMEPAVRVRKEEDCRGVACRAVQDSGHRRERPSRRSRGLLINEAGIACILGSGSNSCYYDGRAIVKNVRSLGYILGDEGSAAYIGKRFLSDCLKDIAPAQLVNDFSSISICRPTR